jgi:thioredoxin-dependent peroxiredoxin
MQRRLVGLLLSAAVALPVWAALKTGDAAPDFSAQASMAGKAFTYSLADALKKGPVVVYFYPSAFTEGCNVEAHTFSERRAEFDAAGATIIGVSLDSISRLNDFSADPKYCAGRIAVASDADGKIVAAYKLKVSKAPAPVPDSRGVLIDHGFAERTTFVVTPDGKIAATIGGMTPTANVEAALKAVQTLAKDKGMKTG